jgi:arylsulfatase
MMKFLLSFFLLFVPFFIWSQVGSQPNVIIIITDDQGYGDFGFTGNPHVKTPVIDRLAAESIQFNNFYVSPVCAPTRASLMTGRYSLRTGVRDTYNGGAIMASNEVTIAEVLKGAGYKTGIFGKWHLGDNFPSRPTDQGFDEALIHLSGGMGQVGDFTNYFKGDSSYFDPILWHNNQQQSYQGYCSDIFTEQAIQFIEDQKQEPFFCYLSFNAPHTPLQVPDSYYKMYQNIDPSAGFEQDGRPFPAMTEKDKEDARKVYAMVSNIDDNIGRLLQKLDDLAIAEQTLVLFMTDNGPQQFRYTAGLRDRKSSVYRGGIKVPLLFRYPELTTSIKKIDASAAHIDLLPTIVDLCEAKLPMRRIIDGKSLLPLIEGKESTAINQRSLFFHWTRRSPELYNNMALQKGPYKLVGHTDYDAPIEAFSLYNINEDPFEQNDLINQQKNIAYDLKKELDNCYTELIQSPNLMQPPLIGIGYDAENPVVLNRNDAAGERGIWAEGDVFGQWNVDLQAGYYNFTYKFREPVVGGGQMYLETNQIIHQKRYKTGDSDIIQMNKVFLPAMKGVLTPFYAIKGKRIFPFWVEIEKTK